MKRAASRKLRVLTMLLVASTFSSLPHAVASIYSFSTTNSVSGTWTTSLWGQTFTIPAGKSGALTSISNFQMAALANPSPDVGRIRIYNSPSKTTLLATALNDVTIPITASGFSATYTFTADFTPFAVTQNTQYYFELERISGTGNYYFFGNSSNPYSGGSNYRDGTIDTSYDLGFTVNIETTPAPVSATIGLTSGSRVATYRSTSQLKVTTNVASKVSFYVNGKIISGCRNIATASLIAYCNWMPSIHGAVTLKALATPIDTATATAGSISTQAIGVATRSNRR